MSRHNPINWNEAGLGLKPDKIIADELSVHVDTVKRMRKKLGIPPYTSQLEWSKVDFSLSNESLSLQLNCHVNEIMRQRAKLINWDEIPLGSKPDIEIASELRIHTATVGRKRQDLSIPAFDKDGITNWDDVPFGTKPDTVIAEELGVNPGRVSYHRKKRNIAPFLGIYLTQEGEPCRSILEAKYDAHLHHKKIPHQHEIPIMDSPYVADFYLETGLYVEIVGMLGFGHYDENYKNKKKYYEHNKINVKWLYTDEVNNLYKTCPIELKFRNSICIECNTPDTRIVKNLCTNCYARHLNQKKIASNNCEYCGKICVRRFCNMSCYWNSMRYNIDWEEADRLLKNNSIAHTARLLNLKRQTLSRRLRLRK